MGILSWLSGLVRGKKVDHSKTGKDSKSDEVVAQSTEDRLRAALRQSKSGDNAIEANKPAPSNSGEDLSEASAGLAGALDLVLSADPGDTEERLSDEDRAELVKLRGMLDDLAKIDLDKDVSSDELQDLMDGLPAMADGSEPESDDEGSAIGAEEKTRRELIRGIGGILLGGGAVTAMMAPQRAHAMFGVDGSIIVTAIVTFANKLFSYMNSSLNDLNNMFGDLGGGLTSLGDKLGLELEEILVQSSNGTDKQITALGALGDRLSEQMVANAQVSASLGSQPGSGVCGDETIGAASARISNRVQAQTNHNDSVTRESRVNAAKASTPGRARQQRKERIERIRSQASSGNTNDWNVSSLSYSRTIAPGHTNRRTRELDQAGSDYIQWSREAIPNNGDYFPENTFFNANSDRMITMIMQREARLSVADHTISSHFNEGIADTDTYRGMKAYFGENVRVQEDALRQAVNQQMSTANDPNSNSSAASLENDVAVNRAALALSKNLHALLDEYSTGQGSERGISKRGIEEFRIRRWTGPEYKAFLRSSGPEPAPLLRDLISLQGDIMQMEKARLDEQRLTNDLLQQLLRETVDSNTIRDREMREAHLADRA